MSFKIPRLAKEIARWIRHILEKINGKLGRNAVNSIKITVGSL